MFLSYTVYAIMSRPALWITTQLLSLFKFEMKILHTTATGRGTIQQHPMLVLFLTLLKNLEMSRRVLCAAFWVKAQ